MHWMISDSLPKLVQGLHMCKCKILVAWGGTHSWSSGAFTSVHIPRVHTKLSGNPSASSCHHNARWGTTPTTWNQVQDFRPEWIPSCRVQWSRWEAETCVQQEFRRTGWVCQFGWHQHASTWAREVAIFPRWAQWIASFHCSGLKGLFTPLGP